MSDEWKWVLRSASSTRPGAAIRRRSTGWSTRQPAPRADVLRYARHPEVSAGEARWPPASPTRRTWARRLRWLPRFTAQQPAPGERERGIRVADRRARRGVPHQLQPRHRRRQPGGFAHHAAIVSARAPGSRPRRGRTGSAHAPLHVRRLQRPSQLTEDVTLQYGFTLDSVSFLDRLNYFSPYARLSYKAGNNAKWMSPTPPAMRGPTSPARLPGCGSAARARHARPVPAHLSAGRAAEDPARQRIRVRRILARPARGPIMFPPTTNR